MVIARSHSHYVPLTSCEGSFRLCPSGVTRGDKTAECDGSMFRRELLRPSKFTSGSCPFDEDLESSPDVGELRDSKGSGHENLQFALAATPYQICAQLYANSVDYNGTTTMSLSLVQCRGKGSPG